MTAWEYHRTKDSTTANLNALGAQGWEVCASTGGYVVLKRTKAEERHCFATADGYCPATSCRFMGPCDAAPAAP